jgi:hypothetical protein
VGVEKLSGGSILRASACSGRVAWPYRPNYFCVMEFLAVASVKRAMRFAISEKTDGVVLPILRKDQIQNLIRKSEFPKLEI